MMKLIRERQRIEEWLTETLNELKATNTFKCLIDNVTQEKHAQERLAEVRQTRNDSRIPLWELYHQQRISFAIFLASYSWIEAPLSTLPSRFRIPRQKPPCKVLNRQGGGTGK